MKVVIIGASGYIGSDLLTKSRTRLDVVGASAQGGGGLAKFSLLTPERFDDLLVDQGDFVVLTAAISSPDICRNQSTLARQVNVIGTVAVIAATLSRGAKVIFFSSDTVYGETSTTCDESSPLHPAGDYALMKREVEERFRDEPGFKTVRLSYVFSRYDKFTKYLSSCAANGNPAEVFDPFDRAVVHRADVVDAVLGLVDRWDTIAASVINVGGPALVSRRRYAELVRDLACPALAFNIVKPPPEFFVGRPRVIHMVSPRLESVLGRPATALEDAIRQEFALDPAT